MSRLSTRALIHFAALCASLSLAACCPKGQVATPETPVAVAPEPVVAPEVVGTIALGAACGPGVGDCDAAGYCAFPEANACGDGGVVGVCTARPRGCFKDCPGVCGCDGARYCNACVAQGRGLSVRHAGACTDRMEENR